MEPTITRLGNTRDSLGEGPWWDHASQKLFWVDSVTCKVRSRPLDSMSDDVRTWTLPQRVGSVAIANDTTAVVALENGVYRLDLATSDERSRLELIAGPAPDTRLRFNDGKTDRQGRFVTGTMGIKDRSSGIAALYRLEGNRLVRLVDDVIVTNGPCFSPDGALFYFTDGRRRILRYRYDAATGALDQRRLHIDMKAHGSASDGATIDADGCLWTALIGSAEIACFAPDGALVRRIAMPCRLPSSVMFAGPALDRLIVTSISDSGNRTADGVDDGGLFVIDGLGARGVPEKRVEGKTT